MKYLNVGAGVLLWERSEPEVWLDNGHLWEDLAGLLGLDGWVNDDIVTWHPVDWGGDLVLVASLERVDDTENLGGVTAGGGWVGEDGTDGLLWVDDEDRADGESDTLAVNVGGVLVVDPMEQSASARSCQGLLRRYSHVVGEGDLALLVANDWELELGAGDLVDILDPATVGLNGVGRETDELDTALGELWLELGESTELGGADWGVVLWVGEEDDPVVANELVEVDWSGGGLSIEVWGNATQTERGGGRHGGVFWWGVGGCETSYCTIAAVRRGSIWF